jgi:hypothetical protein
MQNVHGMKPDVDEVGLVSIELGVVFKNRTRTYH